MQSEILWTLKLSGPLSAAQPPAAHCPLFVYTAAATRNDATRKTMPVAVAFLRSHEACDEDELRSALYRDPRCDAR